MKEQEAIKELYELSMYVEHAFTEEHKSKFFESLQMATKALEKQIPKKPRFYNGNYYCPVCDDLVGYRATIMKWANKFCKHCGQAIKW